MKPDDSIALADGSRDHAHPALFVDGGRPNPGVEREAAFVAYRKRPKPLEFHARILCVQGKRHIPRDDRPALEAEDVVHSARPDQAVGSKVAFPQARVVGREPADFLGRKGVRDSAIEDVTELKLG